MISDESMKEAALELDGMMLDNLPDRGELDFSPAFERKMKKLIYRRKHPVMSHPAFRVAAAILVLVLLSSAVILAIPDAQASFKGLFYEQKDGRYSYFLPGYVDADDLRTYHLGWIPEGYTVEEEMHNYSDGMVIYRSQDRKNILFLYKIRREDDDTQISHSFQNVEHQWKETIVNGRSADLFEMYYSNGEVSYCIKWMNEEQSILFTIWCEQMEPESVKMAENVIAREPDK